MAQTGGSRREEPKSGGWRRRIWLALLVVASAGFSYVFACATPFPALAALAAITLSRRDALSVVGAVWLVDQLVGYVVLDYPRTLNSAAWGVALLAAAVVACLAVRATEGRVAGGRFVQAAAALLVAFVVYEVALLAVAVAALGGTQAFAPAIVARVLAINAGALVALYALDRLGTALGVRGSRALQVSPAGRPV
jgi:hypothetical protein